MAVFPSVSSMIAWASLPPAYPQSVYHMLKTVDPQERSTWRSGVRSALRAASQLPRKGPTDVEDAPAPAP